MASRARNGLSALGRFANLAAGSLRPSLSSEVSSGCANVADLWNYRISRSFAPRAGSGTGSRTSSRTFDRTGTRPRSPASAEPVVPTKLGTAADTDDQFWAVDGDIIRVKANADERLFKMAEPIYPIENKHLTRRQKNHTRLTRVLASRVTQSLAAQELFWSKYLLRFQHVRDEWEKMYWDGVPIEIRREEKVDKNDPFTILGLERRIRPYSPVELKSAYREMALKFHPDHNPGKDAEAKFERIWSAYKMLQHSRSWR